MKKLITWTMLILISLSSAGYSQEYTREEKVAIAKRLNQLSFYSQENFILYKQIESYKTIVTTQSNLLMIERVRTEAEKEKSTRSVWYSIGAVLIFIGGFFGGVYAGK